MSEEFVRTICSKASGSFGTITAFPARDGFRIRDRVVPNRPNTTKQNQQQTAIITAAKRWRLILNENDRQSWRDLTKEIPYTNHIGRARRLSGFNLHNSREAPRVKAGTFHLAGAPPPPHFIPDPQFVIIGISLLNLWLIAWTPGQAWDVPRGLAWFRCGLSRNLNSDRYHKRFSYVTAIPGSAAILPLPILVASPFNIAPLTINWFTIKAQDAQGRQSRTLRVKAPNRLFL